MRYFLTGLSLVALISCGENQERLPEQKVVGNNISFSRDINQSLLSDMEYWIKNGIKLDDQRVILQRCGYQIKRSGHWGIYQYVSDGNNSVPFTSDLDWPFSAKDIDRFIASYHR
ncbi:MAG: hypothetical protein AABW71_05235 [Nanoarchaeota archaeon]|mgnify:CR=1 FL=1